MNSPTSNAVASKALPLSIPLGKPKSSQRPLVMLPATLTPIKPQEIAIAIRDKVNGVCPDRLTLCHVQAESTQSNAKLILFYKDVGAPAEFWEDIDGASLQVMFDPDLHTIDATVHALCGGMKADSDKAVDITIKPYGG